MVKISLLDKGPFYYHEYERALRPLQTMRFDKHGKARPEYERDQDGFVLYEQPGKDWCLSYEPAYIITDEQWLIDRILDYAKDAFDKVDIHEPKGDMFSCSIPQERLDLCIPPTDRIHRNVPAHNSFKQYGPATELFSDGYADGENWNTNT